MDVPFRTDRGVNNTAEQKANVRAAVLQMKQVGLGSTTTNEATLDGTWRLLYTTELVFNELFQNNVPMVMHLVHVVQEVVKNESSRISVWLTATNRLCILTFCSTNGGVTSLEFAQN